MYFQQFTYLIDKNLIDKRKKADSRLEFLDYFTNSHLNNIKSQIENLRIHTEKAILYDLDKPKAFPTFSLACINESNYENEVYDLKKNGLVTYEFCENYNSLVTIIKAVEKYREMNGKQHRKFHDLHIKFSVEYHRVNSFNKISAKNTVIEDLETIIDSAIRDYKVLYQMLKQALDLIDKMQCVNPK